MLVRRAVVDDIPALLPLVQQYWQHESLPGFSNPRVAQLLGRLLGSPPLGAAWLAGDAAGQPLGYLVLVYVFSLEHQGLTAEVDELFVLPAQRGAGLGAQLLGAAEAEAVRRGCTSISLQIGRGNARAEAFYRRHGYRARAAFHLLDKDLPGA